MAPPVFSGPRRRGWPHARCRNRIHRDHSHLGVWFGLRSLYLLSYTTHWLLFGLGEIDVELVAQIKLLADFLVNHGKLDTPARCGRIEPRILSAATGDGGQLDGMNFLRPVPTRLSGNAGDLEFCSYCHCVILWLM